MVHIGSKMANHFSFVNILRISCILSHLIVNSFGQGCHPTKTTSVKFNKIFCSRMHLKNLSQQLNTLLTVEESPFKVPDNSYFHFSNTF